MILLVDSYESSRCALASLLCDSGFEVVQAANGLEGLHEARQRLPDLVIVDLWPFFSGTLQMVERLRTREPAHRVPVLVVTSSVSSRVRGGALRVGCEGYLEKPCSPGAVLAEVHRLLGRSPLSGATSQLSGSAIA